MEEESKAFPRPTLNLLFFGPTIFAWIAWSHAPGSPSSSSALDTTSCLPFVPGETVRAPRACAAPSTPAGGSDTLTFGSPFPRAVTPAKAGAVVGSKQYRPKPPSLTALAAESGGDRRSTKSASKSYPVRGGDGPWRTRKRENEGRPGANKGFLPFILFRICLP